MRATDIDSIYETLCIPNLFVECDLNPFEDITDNNKIKMTVYTVRNNEKIRPLNIDYEEGIIYLLIDGFRIPFPDFDPSNLHLSVSTLKKLLELLRKYRPSIVNDDDAYNDHYHYPELAYNFALKHKPDVTDYTLDFYIESFYDNPSMRLLIAAMMQTEK